MAAEVSASTAERSLTAADVSEMTVEDASMDEECSATTDDRQAVAGR
jgi:hypothetical protein